jgi:hypothetical protein
LEKGYIPLAELLQSQNLFYRHGLKKEFGKIGGVVRAKRKEKGIRVRSQRF